MDAVFDQLDALLDCHVLNNRSLYSFVECVHHTVDEVLGIAVSGLLSLAEGAQIVNPVELGSVSVEAPQNAVDGVGSLP